MSDAENNVSGAYLRIALFVLYTACPFYAVDFGFINIHNLNLTIWCEMYLSFYALVYNFNHGFFLVQTTYQLTVGVSNLFQCGFVVSAKVVRPVIVPLKCSYRVTARVANSALVVGWVKLLRKVSGNKPKLSALSMDSCAHVEAVERSNAFVLPIGGWVVVCWVVAPGAPIT